MQVCTYLSGLLEACAQKREEDPGDGHMVSGLSKTRVFATGINGHAPWNVSNGHLVTLWDNKQREKIEMS